MTERVGVFGGSFDPIHLGHLIVADSIREDLGLDRMLLVPARRSPLKVHHPGASAADRLAMVRLAIVDRPRFRASSIEVDRTGESYTVDTLREIATETRAELFFLMGYDQLRDLPHWRGPAEILKLAQIVGMSRPHYAAPDLTGLAAIYPDAAARVSLIGVPAIEISSTDLRRRLAAGRSIDFRVPRAVQQYLEERGLYRQGEEAKEKPEALDASGRALTAPW